MHVMDANSLYSSIARDLQVPVGPYTILTNMQELSQIVFDPRTKTHRSLKGEEMIGFAMLDILSPNAGIPFVGVKVSDKYVYTLCNECAKKKKKGFCRHGKKSRKMLVTLTWPEINFIVGELGYKILAIYESYQWAEKRKIFSEFVNLLEHSKLKCESFVGSKEEYCKRMNKINNFPKELELKPNELTPNQSLRKMFKEIMCAVLGKLAQVNCKNQARIIKSQAALNSLFYSNESNLDDIFIIGEACLAVTSAKKSTKIASNKAASMIVYAYITAESRIYMHQAMLKLSAANCRVLAIFNDCLYFVCPFETPLPLKVGKSFFSFKQEYDPLEISCFLSFGVKCNALLLTKENGESQTIIKARGFSLKTDLISKILTFHNISTNFEGPNPKKIRIPQVRTHKKIKSLTAFNTVHYFLLSCKIQTDNILLDDLKTLPLGTKKNVS